MSTPFEHRVVWIFNEFALPKNSTGSARHTLLADALDSLGWRVILIAAQKNRWSSDEPPSPVVAPSPTDSHSGVRRVEIPLRVRGVGGMRRLARMVEFSMRSLLKTVISQTIPRPTVIIGSTPHPFGAVAALIAARVYRVPFILEVRDIWPASLVEILKISERHPVVLLLRVLERTLYHYADAVLTALPGLARYLADKPPKRLTIAPIPVALESIHPSPAPAAHSAFKIAYAGSHGPPNDLLNIIEAARWLQDEQPKIPIEICLIGDGPSKAQLMHRAATLGLTNLTFHHSMPKSALYMKLAEFSAFVISIPDLGIYQYGVSPNKLYDYFALQRPVIIATSTPFNPVADFDAGISVVPGDPSALARAMIQVSRWSPRDRQAAGANGRHYVERYHCPRKVAAIIDAAIRDVLDD